MRRGCSAVELLIRQSQPAKKHVSLCVNGLDSKAAAPQSRNRSKLGQTVFAISGCQHGEVRSSATRAHLNCLQRCWELYLKKELQLS